LALKNINLKTTLRPSIVGDMPLKRTHVVPSLNFKCTPRDIVIRPPRPLNNTTLPEQMINHLKI
jgi:hypothetical protein